METYWFRVKGDVFIWKKKDKYLVYDSAAGNSFSFKDSPELTSVYEALMEVDNLYCVEINSNNLQDLVLADFIDVFTKYKMGDLISKSDVLFKPVSFLPKVCIQRSRDKFLKDQKMLEYENGMSYLLDLTICLNGDIDRTDIKNRQLVYPLQGESSLKYEDLMDVLSQLTSADLQSLHLVGRNVFEYRDFHRLINVLDQMHVKKKIYVTQDQLANNQHYLGAINNDQVHYVVLVSKDNPFDSDLRRKVEGIFSYITWCFYVESVEECIGVERIIEDNAIGKYQIKPVFNGFNENFFEENVFVVEDDLLSLGLKKKDIYMRQTLNSNDFGKLTILSTGDVYANINFSSLGNIKEVGLKGLIYKELLVGDSWLRIRDQEPCTECLFQWMCSSPSNYEIAIGRFNLCHVTHELLKCENGLL